MSDPLLFTRRHALKAMACGFGQMAFAAMAAAESRTASPAVRGLHHRARAKRVIFIFMQGGPSQVDTFDYKPILQRQHGKMMSFDDSRILANSGIRGSNQRVMQSPWDFTQHGESGRFVSDLFPEISNHVDDLCFIHSMQTEGVAHGPATLFLHCGSGNFIRPSMGSWITYGLGSENQNLPGFVTISPSTGNGGPRNYGSAFLPPVFQGTAFGKAGVPAAQAFVRNLSTSRESEGARRRELDLFQELNAEQLRNHPGDRQLEAVINSYELAWRMQTKAPEVLDLSGETEAMRAMYGIGVKETDDFGRQCLTARRLCEAGVRYVQINYGDNSANPAWDQHSNLPKHAEHARAVDKPIAGLLTDLKQRGLLDDTIVWWGGEFGRTPYAEKNGTGRDHNPRGFTVWLAGAGVKRGFAFGETDEFGHVAVKDKVHMHDLHATILHLLGIDHEKLTYRFDGRDFRLTDVHGHVVQEILG